jgi:hypothetical protein
MSKMLDSYSIDSISSDFNHNLRELKFAYSKTQDVIYLNTQCDLDHINWYLTKLHKSYLELITNFKDL